MSVKSFVLASITLIFGFVLSYRLGYNSGRVQEASPQSIADAGTWRIVSSYLNVACSSEAPRGLRPNDPVIDAQHIGTHAALHCWPAEATARALDGGVP